MTTVFANFPPKNKKKLLHSLTDSIDSLVLSPSSQLFLKGQSTIVVGKCANLDGALHLDLNQTSGEHKVHLSAPLSFIFVLLFIIFTLGHFVELLQRLFHVDHVHRQPDRLRLGRAHAAV